MYKDFKHIVLCKNGKIKYINSNSHKRVKVHKTKCVLFNTNSDLYGILYIPMNPSIYNKLASIHDIKFTYQFLYGESDNLYDNDNDGMWVKNIYNYKYSSDLMNKINEIIYSEYYLNDSFWIQSSFFTYCYDALNVSYRIGKKYIKKIPIDKFYDIIMNNRKKKKSKYQYNSKNGLYILHGKKYTIIKNDALYDKKSKYFDKILYNKPRKKILNKIKDSDRCIMHIDALNATEVSKNFLKKTLPNIREIVNTTKIITEYDSAFTLSKNIYNIDNERLSIFYIVQSARGVCMNISDDFYNFTVKSKVLLKKKNKKKKYVKYEEIFNQKNFPGMKYSLY